VAPPFFFFFQGAEVGSTPPVASTPPPVGAAGYTVQVQWATGSFTDITADVVKLNISRSLWTLFDSVTAGEMQVEVINVRGRYTPNNPSGPFAGLIKNGRESRVFVAPTSGTTVQLFQGFLDQVSLSANDVENGRVTLSFRDKAREIRHRLINTTLWVNYNISSQYENILTATDIPVSKQLIPKMPDEAALAWFKDASADEAISELISSNFSKGFVARDGTIRILGRYYDQDVTETRSYSEFLDLTYNLTDDAVINDARFESEPRRPVSGVATLSYITQPISIPASSSVSFVMEYLDPNTKRGVPAINLIQPVSGSDYHAGTSEGFGDVTALPSLEGGAGQVGPAAGTTDNATGTTSAAVMFFGETAVSTVFNGSGNTVYLNKYQLRGQHLPETPRLQAITISSESQVTYGRRSFALSSDFLSDRNYLVDYGAFLVDRQKDSIPQIQASIRHNINSAALTLDPGTLVSVTNTNAAINSLHFIKRIEHDIDLSVGLQHTISLDLERVVQYTHWTLGHTIQGRLDSGNTLAF
jgi:hypothetical protein